MNDTTPIETGQANRARVHAACKILIEIGIHPSGPKIADLAGGLSEETGVRWRNDLMKCGELIVPTGLARPRRKPKGIDHTRSGLSGETKFELIQIEVETQRIRRSKRHPPDVVTLPAAKSGIRECSPGRVREAMREQFRDGRAR